MSHQRDKAAVADFQLKCQNTHMRECDEIDWQSWELVEDDQRTLLNKQLRRELGVAHQLHEAVERLRVIARDCASDDVLVTDLTETVHAYVVHLTWSDRPSENENFPSTCSMSKSLLPLKYQ